MLNIGQNIAILRLRKKLTQEELADKGNVSAQTIADFENGVTQPDVETLAKIAKNTGVDIHFLIYGFPTLQEEKKQKIQFIIFAVLTIALWYGNTALGEFASEWKSHYFDLGPLMIYYTLVTPLFLVTVGYTIILGAKLFLNLPPLRGKHTDKLHIGIGLLLLAYFIFAIPPNIGMIYSTVARFLTPNTEYFSADLPTILSNWLHLLMYLIIRNNKQVFIFIILGSLFGLTKPTKPHSNDS